MAVRRTLFAISSQVDEQWKLVEFQDHVVGVKGDVERTASAKSLLNKIVSLQFVMPMVWAMR